MWRRCRRIGLPATGILRRFRRDHGRAAPPFVRCGLQQTHPLRRCVSSSEHGARWPALRRASHQPCGRRAPVQSASHGVFRPSSRHRPEASTESCTAPGRTLRSVLGVPPALDGLLRFRLCRLVSSCSRVQGFSLQGFVPRREAVPVFTGQPCPRVVEPPVTPARTGPPREALDCRAFTLHVGCGGRRGWLNLRRLRAPPGFCLLRVFTSVTGAAISRSHPPTTFTTTGLPSLVHCGFADAGSGWRVSTLPTRTRFSTCSSDDQ